MKKGNGQAAALIGTFGQAIKVPLGMAIVVSELQHMCASCRRAHIYYVFNKAMRCRMA